MNIIRLNGEEKRLYELVAPLVMNPAIIRQNNNYPYKTEKDYIWYIVTDDGGKVEGFMPLKPKISGYYIDNYYIGNDNKEVIDLLLTTILREFGEENEITALVKKNHAKEFTKFGFISWSELKNYTKMDYKNPEKRQENDTTTQRI